MKFTAVSFRRISQQIVFFIHHETFGDVFLRTLTFHETEFSFTERGNISFFPFWLALFLAIEGKQKSETEFSEWSSFVGVVHTNTRLQAANACVLVYGWFNGRKRRKTVKSIQKIMLNIPSSVACHVSVSPNVFTALRVNFNQNFSVLILKWNKNI